MPNKYYRKFVRRMPRPRNLSEKDIRQLDNPKSDSCMFNLLASPFYLFGIVLLLFDPGIGIIVILITLVINILLHNIPSHKSRMAALKATDFVESGNITAAIETLEKSLKTDKDNQENLLTLGYCYHENEDYEKTIQTLKDHCEKYPSNHDALMLLANSYFRTENYENALKAAQNIPSTHSKYIKALQIIALSFYALGQRDIALEVFHKAPLKKKVINKDLVELHYNLAIVYEDMGELTEALKHLKMVIAQDISFGDTMNRIKEIEKELKSK